MDFSQLHCFLIASRTLNFTKTAQLMYMSQQGVSRIIGKLEQELDVPLFYRRNQSLILTDFGKEFVKTAEEMVHQMEAFNLRVDDMRKVKKARIRVALPVGMLHCFPIEAINSFVNAHPEVDLQMKEYSEAQCNDAVSNDDADLAFCVNYEKNNLIVLHPHSEDTFLMVSRLNPLSKYDEIEVNQLKGENFLSIYDPDNLGGQFVRDCIDCGFEPEVVFRSSDVHLLERMCAMNTGICFYVGRYVENPVEGAKLIRFKNAEDYIWTVYLVCRQGKELSEVEKEFVQLIQEQWK